MSAISSALGSRSRIALLAELQRQPAQTAAALAADLGLHQNTVRGHLQRLADAGLITSEPEHRYQRGRPRVLYSPASGLTGSNPAAAAQARRALTIGRAYRTLEPERPAPDDRLDVLEEHLESCGFEPRRCGDPLTVALTCPFADLYAEIGSELCGVHAGIIRSVLDRADGEVTLAELAPQEGSGTCLLRLHAASRG